MSRMQQIVLLLIAIEILAGGWVIAGRLSRPLPPRPDVSGYNPHTSQRILGVAERVRPDVASDWADLADIYLAHGFFAESEASYRRAYELARGSGERLYGWAQCLSSMGQLEQAQRRLHDALEAGYDSPEDCWYLLGRIALRMERADEARRAFQQAGALPAARFELAKLDLWESHPEPAREILLQLEVEFPGCHQTHLLRARAESMLGNPALAANYIDLSEVCSSPLPTPTYAFRSHILSIVERFSLSDVVQRSRALLAGREIDRAESLLSQEARDHWDPETADLQADMAYARGELDTQQRHLEAIIEREGADSYRLSRLGLAFSAAGKLNEAAAAHRAAVALDTGPQVIDSLQQLVVIHTALEESETSNRYLAQFHAAVGKQLFWQGQLPAARSALQQSLQIDESDPDAWFYLGQIERFSGNQPAADAAYARCLERNPNHGRALGRREPGL